MTQDPKLMPVLFIGHGNPMNAIEDNKYTQAWRQEIKHISKPQAIIVISAHWETFGAKITGNQQPKIIYDFYGFPQELFEVKYLALGNQKLAQKITQEIPEIQIDNSWGLDHGAWSILTHLYPQANIPVLQISIDKNKSLIEHYNFAKKLNYLRHQNILIIGSGNIVHNLRMAKWGEEQSPHDFAIDFVEAIKDAITTKNHHQIINCQNLAGAKLAVPTLEHFIPLLYALALQQENETAKIFAQGIEMSSISMDSVMVC